MKGQSELTVVIKTKDLCSYVMEITQKSPKHFRYTFVGRMQNLCLDAMENLFRANDVFVVKGDGAALAKRNGFQHEAMLTFKILAYVSQVAMEQKCILPKHFENISSKVTDCLNLCGAWLNSDKKKYQ